MTTDEPIKAPLNEPYLKYIFGTSPTHKTAANDYKEHLNREHDGLVQTFRAMTPAERFLHIKIFESAIDQAKRMG